MGNYNNAQVTDLAYLKQVSNGDSNFINEMIDVYLKQTPEAISDLEKHLKNKNWKLLRAVIHKMKPSCPFFGLHDLYKTVTSIEEYAEEGTNLHLLPGMIVKVKATCDKAMVELNQQRGMV